jgi:hypothetical protein
MARLISRRAGPGTYGVLRDSTVYPGYGNRRLSVPVHFPGLTEPLNSRGLGNVGLLEGRAELRLHELFLVRLRLPDLDHDQLVARFSGDVTEHGTWPVTWIG